METPEPSADNFCLTIDHIAIAVPDLDEAVAWYEKNLAFKLVERRLTKGAATSMLSAVMKAGSATVVLVQGTSPQSQVSQFVDKFGPGVQHVAFSVSSMDRAMGSLCKGGAKPDIDMVEDIGIKQIFLRRDPGSGVRVELIERRDGEFSDKSVETLFRAFESRGLY